MLGASDVKIIIIICHLPFVQGLGKGFFLCPFGRVLTTEGRVRSGNGTSYFLSKFMDVVLSVKFSQLLKRHLADEYSTERL